MVHTQSRKLVGMVASCLGASLLGVAAVPAHADSVRSEQWHLDAMRAEEMWESSTGEGITVAVVDSGVDSELPDLRGQVLDGKDFTDREGNERDDFDGHGSRMAAVIAGTGKRPDDKASFGLAPGAKILPLRVPLGGEAEDLTEGTRYFSRTVGSAIRYAADSEARIINISLAGHAESAARREFSAAVAYAISKGKLIFAGVGNSAKRDNPVLYPAATPGVVGVAATDRKGATTEESEYGPQVDLAAPGEDIVTACPGGTEVCVTHGTSDATALASASAALIWAKYPDWTANQVLRVMINTASGAKSGKKRTDYIGYGIVRPRITLKEPGDPGPADVYPIPGELEPVSSEPGSSGAVQEGQEPQAAGGVGGDGGDTALWVGLGLGAAALIGGGAAAAVVVARRRRGAAGSAQPPVAVPYQQQAPYPHPYPHAQVSPQAPQQSYGAPPWTPDPPGSPGAAASPSAAPPGASYPPPAGGTYPPGSGGGPGPQARS
ncbi:type VII secretion-associated serine protease mycosin [Streptomyces xinghaiensis]|uniref:type VII secretion-associated serine protease mycosin n=1 Tax=Streptomyces xinghaiensis TaxID=1038928 RepID=UPI0037B0A336